MDLENLTDRPRQNDQEQQNVFDARAIFLEAPSTGDDSAAKILARAKEDDNKFLPVLPITDLNVPRCGDGRARSNHVVGDSDFVIDVAWDSHYKHLPPAARAGTMTFRSNLDDLEEKLRRYLKYLSDDIRPDRDFPPDELGHGRNYYREFPKSRVSGYRDTPPPIELAGRHRERNWDCTRPAEGQ